VVSGTASTGEILSINPPYNRSSYSIQFDGPYVTCSLANSTVREFIDALLEKRRSTVEGTFIELVNAYYAFEPSFDVTAVNNDTVTVNGVNLTPLLEPRMQRPGNGTNELWATFWMIQEGSGRQLHQGWEPLRNWGAPL